ADVAHDRVAKLREAVLGEEAGSHAGNAGRCVEPAMVVSADLPPASFPGSDAAAAPMASPLRGEHPVPGVRVQGKSSARHGLLTMGDRIPSVGTGRVPNFRSTTLFSEHNQTCGTQTRRRPLAGAPPWSSADLRTPSCDTDP